MKEVVAMIATPTHAPAGLLETRARLRSEHHHLTLAQQEMVAAEALQAVDPSLVCDALVADESTVPIFIGLAQSTADDRARTSWLTLSALQASALKMPTMLALAVHAGTAAPDRVTALRRAIAESDGAVTLGELRELLRCGRGRWIRCNSEIANARDAVARRSWQIVRLAGHQELVEVTGARSRRGRRVRRRSA